MSGRLNIPSNRPWKEIRRKKVSNYEILLNALCDPENQPHQWIGASDELRAVLAKYAEDCLLKIAEQGAEQSDVGKSRDGGDSWPLDGYHAEDAYYEGLREGAWRAGEIARTYLGQRKEEESE
jgi:hypothetical protein